MSFVHAQDWGIEMNSWCLTNGTCKLNIYKTLQLREDTQGQNTAQYFIQDLFLTATFFIGTMAVIGFLISGLMMIFGWANEASYEKGKKGMKYSIIGIILVTLSYTAIRAVEFIAKWET